jgi:hypothetical protein
LREIQGLKGLTRLGLWGTGVTDAGLKDIKGLSNLIELDLAETAVSDAGLKELEGLKGLTRLDLGNTDVTDAGVKELRKALPDCRIVRQPPSRARPAPMPVGSRHGPGRAMARRASSRIGFRRTFMAATLTTGTTPKRGPLVTMPPNHAHPLSRVRAGLSAKVEIAGRHDSARIDLVRRPVFRSVPA